MDYQISLGRLMRKHQPRSQRLTQRNSTIGWMSENPKLSVIEGDLRDAKRRISAAKGPRKKSKANGDGPAASSDGEDGGSHSVEDDD